VGGCGTSTALPPGQHFNRMDLLMFIRSIASCFVLLSACQSDRPDPPTGREAVIAELESCGLHGRFEVGPVTGETGCEGAPTEGGVVEVSVASDGAIRLAVGGFELPATLTSCRLEASACTRETDSTSSIETYRAIDAALERTHASLAIERASGAGTFSSSCATDASFSLAPIAAPSGCDPTGTFVADADAPIEGACDLAWPMGVVEVRRDPDGTFTVDWAGTEIDGLVLDEASCSLRGSRGESSGTSIDLWSYNGAMRTVMLALALEGDVLVGTASDRLEGETFDGLSCAGGTFRLSASRETAEVERFEAACAIERPVICGDRMCEAERGESCTCGDCTCGAGTECVPATGACLRGCTSPADACGAASDAASPAKAGSTQARGSSASPPATSSKASAASSTTSARAASSATTTPTGPRSRPTWASVSGRAPSRAPRASAARPAIARPTPPAPRAARARCPTGARSTTRSAGIASRSRRAACAWPSPKEASAAPATRATSSLARFSASRASAA
jgi:hypothetical protein